MTPNVETPGRKMNWPLAAACCAALTMLFALQQWGVQTIVRRQVTLGTALQLQAVTWGLWLALLPAIAGVVRRDPLGGRPTTGWWVRNLTIGLLLVSTHIVLASIGRWLLDVSVTSDLSNAIANGFSAGFASNCLRYSAIVGVLHAVAYHHMVRVREQRAAQLETDLARAQLGNVAAYLRPHFLFNTLNSIAILIADDPKLTERMVAELSDLLRASLTAEPQRQVRLDEELAFTDKYLAIERVRFPDRLRVRVEASEEARRALVPHLILQPLVENAIRHGIAPLEAGGSVAVAAARHNGHLQVIVRDDGVGVTPDDLAEPVGTGIGLLGVRARLTSLYGSDHQFDVRSGEPSGTVATIEIPYRISAS